MSIFASLPSSPASASASAVARGLQDVLPTLTCGEDNLPEAVLHFDVHSREQLLIWVEGSDTLDLQYELRHGTVCPGQNLILCHDEPDYAHNIVMNPYPRPMSVYMVVSSWTECGAVTVNWEVSKVRAPLFRATAAGLPLPRARAPPRPLTHRPGATDQSLVSRPPQAMAGTARVSVGTQTPSPVPFADPQTQAHGEQRFYRRRSGADHNIPGRLREGLGPMRAGGGGD